MSEQAVRSPDGGQLARIRPVGANRPKALSGGDAWTETCGSRPGWLWPGYHCPLDKELRRTYGFGCSDYRQLLVAQGGVCRRCGQPPRARRLVVDEDHDTGEVWGLLHFGCNRRISQLDRRYLRQPPPVRLLVPEDRQRAAERRRQQKRARTRRHAAKPTTDAVPAENGSYAEKVAAALRSSTPPGGTP